MREDLFITGYFSDRARAELGLPPGQELVCPATVYLVVQDETDYDGERTYPAAFTTQQAAEQFAVEQGQWHRNLLYEAAQLGKAVGDWVPRFSVHAVPLRPAGDD